jgi:hypothetical protein
LDGFWSGDFDLFFRCVLQQDPVSSTLWVSGEGLQACVLGDAPTNVRSTTTSSRRVAIVVFKALYGDDVFAGVPIPHGAISNLRNTKNKERKKAG